MHIDFVKLGAYIRNARTQQGKTLEEMASQTGCSAEFLQNLEKGLRKPGITAQTKNAPADVFRLPGRPDCQKRKAGRPVKSFPAKG